MESEANNITQNLKWTYIISYIFSSNVGMDLTEVLLYRIDVFRLILEKGTKLWIKSIVDTKLKYYHFQVLWE